MEKQNEKRRKESDLVAKVIPDPYLNILSEETINLCYKGLGSLLSHFNEKDDSGYRIKNKTAVKLNKDGTPAKRQPKPIIQRMYPKLKDLKKPYSLCPLDKLKAVIVLIEPYNNGEATGIPLQVKPSEYLPKFQLQAGQQDVDCVDEAHMVNSDILFSGVDWELLLSQGVLVIHSSMTSEESKLAVHFNHWLKFFRHLIRDLHNHKNDLVFLTIGNLLKAKLSNQMFKEQFGIELDLIQAPDAYYTVEHRQAFRKFRAFQRLNNQLIAKGHEPLVFT